MGNSNVASEMSMASKPYLLSIHCMTYNQSAYITDALNGFTMQRTNFPFVAVVVDDASTDGEQEVIKSYIDEQFDHSIGSGYKEWETEDALWTFAQHKENENCHFVVAYLKKNLYKQQEKKETLIRDWMNSKYIALCEGDDYWTDSLKLQKQVVFMEEHPDFSMCLHGTTVLQESDRGITIYCESMETREYFPDDVFPRWTAHTSSFLYKREAISKFRMRHAEWLESGDTVIVLKCMHVGRVWSMHEHMSVYRMNNTSIMSSYNQKSQESHLRHLKCLMINFPKIDREYCIYSICSYDYERLVQKDGNKSRLYYLFDAFTTSPLFMYKITKSQIKKVFKRVLNR